MTDNERQTGRTFRMVLEAAMLASDGFPVYVVMNTEEDARWAATERGWMLCKGFALRLSPTVYTFPNGGFLHFMGAPADPEAFRIAASREAARVFHDHTVK